MAVCLHPKTIPNPAVHGFRQLRFITDQKVLRRYGRENLRPVLADTIVVPCGKCLACLKNKQSSMVVRCLREAEKRGSFGFMTLTYDDDHLPITESMWRVDLRTGSEEMVEAPEFLSRGFHPDPVCADLFRSEPSSPLPRYRMFVHSRIMEFEWQIRLTPSICRLDVRQWLKQARIQYERDYGEKLPDFSYAAISEYGARSCRPHYHLAFFGLKRKHLDYLLDAWRFGKVKQVRMVSAVNKDRSSGFVRASKYIGKYMSKGKFECQSVSCGAAEKPRVCQSLGFGTKDLQPVRDFVLCKDMVGAYDIRTLLKYDGQPLSDLEISRLVSEIPKRLVFKVDEKVTLPLPRLIREKIFKYDDPQDKTKKATSPLWTMVASSIRDEHDRLREREFEVFCSLHPERANFENLAEFAYWQEFCSGVEEAVMQEDFRAFYARSNRFSNPFL